MKPRGNYRKFLGNSPRESPLPFARALKDVRGRGEGLVDASLDEMEAAWQSAKGEEDME